MGNKIVTVPYESTGQSQSAFSGLEHSKDTRSNPSSQANQHHVRAAVSVSASQMPSECPMHQEKKKEQDSGACPIKSESDINPTNMVSQISSRLKSILFLT